MFENLRWFKWPGDLPLKGEKQNIVFFLLEKRRPLAVVRFGEHRRFKKQPLGNLQIPGQPWKRSKKTEDDKSHTTASRYERAF